MSSEVKRYSLSEFAEQYTYPIGPGTYISATDYDALHAEAEALRDQNRDLLIEADGWFSRVNGVEAKLYAMRADLEEARGLLRDARELISHGDFDTGVCCCGSSVAGHGLGDGHSPVDEGGYYAGGVSERIDAFLATHTAHRHEQQGGSHDT